ncbi:hypothetical protein TRFO_08113 [Tritrichomonas foetus]|uniref:Reverse transcriptase domain-containing protein n=1 Tax=Tritrichomonas foetus TaxID=1144522 RepID=A0A1J4JRG7_9EUKA|nr:hypothetical protein TRFO_08113 [Tritrichomonas foetus]|eukprot:OHT00118.1 hypothetical protein TRFO_08113 [Tritrichomonas foetus]
MIFNNLKHIGFDEGFIDFFRNCYKDSYNIIQTLGFKTDKITIRKGVKQGCPMSPLLFDVAIDPLLRIVHAKHHDDGVCDTCIQAYADDIILISKSSQGLDNMLCTLESFCDYSCLKINAAKCGIYTYILDNNRRVSTDTIFHIFGQEIPKIQLLSLKEYLGAPIARSHVVKMVHSNALIQEITNKINLIDGSPLRLNQKLDAVRRFIIPSLDYELTCNNCRMNDLNAINKLIRKMINSHLNVNSTPIAAFHVDWKDGGLGLQDLTERAKALYIKAFMELNYWSNSRTKSLFKKFTIDERNFRRIQKNDDNSIFMKWNLNSLRQGTQSLCIKAIKALRKLNIQLKKSDDNFSLVDLSSTTNYDKIDDTHKLLLSLKRMFNERWKLKLTSLPLKGHTFHTTIKSPYSSFFLSPAVTKANDEIVKFAVNARCNNLPTGEVVAHGDVTPQCIICHQGLDNLKHRLNCCNVRKSEYKIRHNYVVEDIIKAIDDVHQQHFLFHRSKTIRFNGLNNLEDDNKRLMPDIWFIDHTNNVLNIIEVSVPYGCISERNGGVSTLDLTIEEKRMKYAHLCEDCENKSNMKVQFYPIIVSSLGAIPKQTLSALKRLLKNNMSKVKYYAHEISFSAIRGSARIYWNTGKFNNNSVDNNVGRNNNAYHDHNGSENDDTDDNTDHGNDADNNIMTLGTQSSPVEIQDDTSSQ